MVREHDACSPPWLQYPKDLAEHELRIIEPVDDIGKYAVKRIRVEWKASVGIPDLTASVQAQCARLANQRFLVVEGEVDPVVGNLRDSRGIAAVVAVVDIDL